MNADTMEPYVQHGGTVDGVRYPYVFKSYRPPARVPNYELPVNVQAREEGYALGLLDGRQSINRARIFATAMAVGAIAASLVIILGSLVLA